MEKRVLVCDDDTGIIEVLSYIFANKDYAVRGVTTGEAILSEINAFQPNLILLDIMLPKKRGDEIAREIQSVYDIPIYFVSGVDNIADLAKQTQVAGYVRKPFDIEEIEALIDKTSLD